MKESLLEAYNRLIEKGFKREQIALGFVDETSPQTTANTARVWHVGPADIVKNTTRYKANAVGFYEIVGHSVSEFLSDSTQKSIEDFVEKIREANSEYPAIIVILDNFSSHKTKMVRKMAIELDIELVFLPPYSPDLNPIGFIRKTVKHHISLEFIRSLNHLRDTIHEVWVDASRRCSYEKNWINTFVTGSVSYRDLCS